MFFKSLCFLVLWMKVASALEGLSVTMESLLVYYPELTMCGKEKSEYTASFHSLDIHLSAGSRFPQAVVLVDIAVALCSGGCAHDNNVELNTPHSSPDQTSRRCTPNQSNSCTFAAEIQYSALSARSTGKSWWMIIRIVTITQ